MYQEEVILEFDKVKNIWAQCALTQYAKTAIQNTHPFLSELEVEAKINETTQARDLMEKCGTPPIPSPDGIGEIVRTAQKGQCLSIGELENTAQMLTAVQRLKDYLAKGRNYEIPLAYYEENLNPLESIKEQIRSQIWNEQVADNASDLLKKLRNEILHTESKMREKADSILRSQKEYMSDSFSTFRNGHICIPVKKEYKFRISGIVIDKSATGSTLFIEPSASGKYYEELQELKIDEENEVRRILYTLTALIADHGEIIMQNICCMEKLDFIFSKGKLSLAYDGIAPKLLRQRCIRLQNARHPLMDQSICVPLQFSIGNGINGIVITGPNTGGKTVAIKTVALNCMMAQCGLHVACESAELCMSSNYLCDIGDGQNLSENLSTFSAHITNILTILKRVNKDSLVILDELGSGTDPAEGMGIAIAILDELKKSGALFLATTHYPEVKSYAEKEASIVNARMTFDKENLKPLYHMVIGEAGESCAFYIAGRLGMPAHILKRAAMEAYGRESSAWQLTENNLLDAIPDSAPKELKKEYAPLIVRKKTPKAKAQISFRRGDSVMVYPDKKVGIVCETANEKGTLRVQLPNKKIWINHKRLKLLVAADELYPQDYDFSIIFDTVANRKLRHQMERKYVEGKDIIYEE
ncbi:MAG: DNA mismatch repair protein MutS [Lachnospiraceae bacterium]|nr:DNA mismatch repair protein MutS [Lachnospiraceae bacterium]